MVVVRESRRRAKIGGSMSWRIERVHSVLRVREYFCERSASGKAAAATGSGVDDDRRARSSNFESNSMQIRWQLCDGRN